MPLMRSASAPSSSGRSTRMGREKSPAPKAATPAPMGSSGLRMRRTVM